MSEVKGYLNLILHAHLPFVRHPEYNDFLEEDWFFEAMTETYVPVLIRLERLKQEGIPFKLTMTVTPPLLTMMEDGHLLGRLHQYLSNRIELLEKEVRGKINDAVVKCAQHYLNEIREVKDFLYHQYHGKITDALKKLQESEHIEIITCPATHGILPLMSGPEAWQAQIRTAFRYHESLFGKKPRGIWLAECGYDTGIDKVLADEGIEYFVMDAHGICLGDPAPVYGVYAPVITNEGVSVFGRDPDSSYQVWSRKDGYPGDPDYRELYRDLGYDADYEYIKPHLHSDGVRRHVGIKYHRVTGPVELNSKAYYDPDVATQKASRHATDFLAKRSVQFESIKNKTKYPPVIVSPYDAELFGHWWYEGPQFLEFLIRQLNSDRPEIEMMTGSAYLDRHPLRQIQTPNPSSWGNGGYNQVWMNGGTSWMLPHQHHAEKRMIQLAKKHPTAQGELKRALNQLLRELLLLQSSDWAFIMTTGTTIPYATRRFREHLSRFDTLSEQISENSIDSAYLEFLEKRDCVFPDIDYRDMVVKNASKSRYVYDY